MENEELNIETYLKILNEMKEKNFSLNFVERIKNEKNFKYLFYLLRAVSDIESKWFWDNLLLSKKKFVKYLYEKEKVSKKFFNEVFYDKEIEDSDIVFEELERNIELLNDNKIFKEEYTYLNSANYLYALYIFNNAEEYNYFYDEFLPSEIEDLEEDEDDTFCFLNSTKESYDVDLTQFEDIKIYYFTEDEDDRAEIDKAIKLQEKEDMNGLLIKNKVDEIEDVFDYLIEVEDDVDKLKDSIKNLKKSFKEVVEKLKE